MRAEGHVPLSPLLVARGSPRAWSPVPSTGPKQRAVLSWAGLSTERPPPCPAPCPAVLPSPSSSLDLRKPPSCDWPSYFALRASVPQPGCFLRLGIPPLWPWLAGRQVSLIYTKLAGPCPLEAATGRHPGLTAQRERGRGQEPSPVEVLLQPEGPVRRPPLFPLSPEPLQELLSQPDAHLVPGPRKGAEPQENVSPALESNSALVATHPSGQSLATQGGRTACLL